MKTIFGSSLLPVVKRRAHVLFTLFVFAQYKKSIKVILYEVGVEYCILINANLICDI
jgi:hypothetical protein